MQPRPQLSRRAGSGPILRPVDDDEEAMAGLSSTAHTASPFALHPGAAKNELPPPRGHADTAAKSAQAKADITSHQKKVIASLSLHPFAIVVGANHAAVLPPRPHRWTRFLAVVTACGFLLAIWEVGVMTMSSESFPHLLNVYLTNGWRQHVAG